MTLHWLQTARGFRRTRSLPLSDRGYRYGMAVFETMRVDGGHVHFLDEHLQSLAAARDACGFPAVDLAPAAEFLRAAVARKSSGVARIHLTAGDGGPGEPVTHCRVLLGFEQRDPSVPQGCGLQIHAGTHHAGGLKTHNYWRQTAPLLAARSAGADETLLFDAAGALVSAAMANVFVVDEAGDLITPALDFGARAGILRAWVCGRRAVRSARIDRNSLLRANEVFLTNSWFGVMPADNLAGRPLPSREVAGKLRMELQAHYDGTVLH